MTTSPASSQSLKDTATTLGVSIRTVQRLIEAGKLTAIKQDRLVVDGASLAAYKRDLKKAADQAVAAVRRLAK